MFLCFFFQYQDAFHRHSWADRQGPSVCMRRDDACPVSLTTIELRAELGVMAYAPGLPDEESAATTLTLLF